MIIQSNTSDVSDEHPFHDPAPNGNVFAKRHGSALRMAIAIPHRCLHSYARTGVDCAPMRSRHVAPGRLETRVWSSHLQNELTSCQCTALRRGAEAIPKSAEAVTVPIS
jgi:hypothetical protein